MILYLALLDCKSLHRSCSSSCASSALYTAVLLLHVRARSHARTHSKEYPERQKTQIKRQIPEGIICILLLLAQGCTLELPYSKDKNQSMMCVTTQCIGKQTHTHQLAQSTDVQYSQIKQTGRRTYKSNKGYRQMRITEGIRTKEQEG